MFTVLLLVETGWLSAGVTWLIFFYQSCPVDKAKDFMLGKLIFSSNEISIQNLFQIPYNLMILVPLETLLRPS